jgi:chlorite dismutase
MTANTFDFVGAEAGKWKVMKMDVVCGLPLEPVAYIDVFQSVAQLPASGIWTLRGFTSNVRYAEKHEREKINASQSELGRSSATYAALIPIRKNEIWWAMAQDERREIFETQSHHTEIGLNYLPAIARKLYHCRDLGQPFDFLTWFEYAPEDAAAFEKLVQSLRQTVEWQYVDREIDIRLKRI